MDLSYGLLALVFILTIIYWFLTRTYDYWKKQNVPCLPSPIPGFGHMLPSILLKENLTTLSLNAYNKTDASAVGFYFLQTPGLIPRDPELVKSIFQTNFNSFHINGFHLDEKVDPVLSKNPFFASDLDTWRITRARTTSHLSGAKLRHLFVIAREVSLKMEDFINRKIKDDGFYECDLKENFTRYTCEIIANAAFGIEGQSFKNKTDRLSFVSVAKTVFSPTLLNSIKQALLFYWPSMGNVLKLSFLAKSADDYFRENVKAILKERKLVKNAPNDYLQFCIDSNGEENIDSIIADLIIFYGDVYETSSTVLSTLFYHLSQNPAVQQKIRGHVISALKESNGVLTYESLKNMNYLEQTIYESMRHLPPIGMLVKECTEEITLTGSDGVKYHLKPGSPLLIPVAGLHGDSKYWPDPDVFDPDRFSPENSAERHKFVFLGFGEGPRMCIGKRLGLMLVKIAAASLLTKYSIENSQKTKKPLELDPSSFMLYIKGGLWGRFEKLNK